MPQYEYVPQSYGLVQTDSSAAHSAVKLRSLEPRYPYSFSFEVVRPDLFRTTFTSEDHPLPPHPSASQPENAVRDVEPFVQSFSSQKRIEIGETFVTVEWTSAPVISLFSAWSGKLLHQDLPFRSYAVDGTGVAHYTRYKRQSLHVGLGEKAAPMNLANRGFVLSTTDCFGYDVYRTDPLYKHVPLLITASVDGCVGMFSTSHSRGSYAIGSEMDGLWGPYKVYRQDHGGLEEYLIVGRTLKDVVRTYADLVGHPRLLPRWALGYIAGGMKYSMLDEPRACDALLEFASKLKHHDIPCSAFQLSSGYTVAESEPKTRNVFTWNRHRFPEPQRFVDAYHAQGIRLIVNLKPYVLETHPEYARLVGAGALFINPDTKSSAIARLWSAGGGESGVGGHIDFTSKAGSQWWYEGVKQLKEMGIDGIWNDNNEYTIPNDSWQCALDEGSIVSSRSIKFRNAVGLWGRSLHTELMAKSSYEASVAVEPDVRPFVLTRSATAGTMRYAVSSWSGDNVTSWEGLKGANALSLTAGMCLLQCYGHDIGGFEGPQPTPELLLRWVQVGIYSSRFAINCFKTSPDNNSVGEVIEPWMYPEITPLIRRAIKRRYEILPYIYSLALESHMFASPPQRWVGWGYESDPEVWTPLLMRGENQFWFGDALLVGCVSEPGTVVSEIYLPQRGDGGDGGYLNLNPPYDYLKAGQWVRIDSNWNQGIPVIAKVGAALPTGLCMQTLSVGERKNVAQLPEDDYRAVEVFPPKGSSRGKIFTTTWYEDDGVSNFAAPSHFTVSYSSTESQIALMFQEDTSSGFVPRWKDIDIVLPVGDSRKVVGVDGNAMEERSSDQRGRKVFRLEIDHCNDG